MKCSVIIPVFESYEVVRRQLIYMNNLGIPDDFEVILIDDGSEPRIDKKVNLKRVNFDLKYFYRNDHRKFTTPCALNYGYSLAQGEYILSMAIDWFISKEIIDLVYELKKSEYLTKPLRHLAWLDENGNLIAETGLKRSSNGIYLIRKDILMELGGWDESRAGNYPTNADDDFVKRFAKKFGVHNIVSGPPVYSWPAGNRPHIFYNDEYYLWKAERDLKMRHCMALHNIVKGWKNRNIVEVGVWHSGLTEHLLKYCGDSFSQYWAVDCWTYTGDEGEGFDKSMWDKLYHHCCRLMVKYPQLRVLRMFSVEAAKLFKDRSLDFVYLDADHRKGSVEADIHAWLPKVKKKGILGGHDYNAPGHKLKYGVKEVVDEIFGEEIELITGAKVWLHEV